MAKVLIADDDPMVLDVVKESLDAYDVVTAADGKQALELARSTAPDVIVLDVTMPQMSGLDVCRALKADPATKGIRILLLTGQGKLAEIEDGFAAKSDDYLVKPFSPRVLAGRVAQLLKK